MRAVSCLEITIAMFSVRRPTGHRIARALEQLRFAPVTYAQAGATREPAPRGAGPSGFVVDHNRVQLGRGAAAFAAACEALRRWEMFGIGWVELLPRDVPIEPGRVVAVLVRRFGVWSLNPCRIVYVLDEAGPVTRFGFAYGTLPGHIAQGEERFCVEWNRGDDSVWYDLHALSRPQHPVARAGRFYVRWLQRRFARASLAAMAAAVRRRMQEHHAC